METPVANFLYVLNRVKVRSWPRIGYGFRSWHYGIIIIWPWHKAYWKNPVCVESVLSCLVCVWGWIFFLVSRFGIHWVPLGDESGFILERISQKKKIKNNKIKIKTVSAVLSRLVVYLASLRPNSRNLASWKRWLASKISFGLLASIWLPVPVLIY